MKDTLILWTFLILFAVAHEYLAVRGLVDLGKSAGWW